MPLSAATRRNPLMINSLAMITMVIHAASFPIAVKQIRAEHTRSLSAKGSMNFPKFVTRLYFLARYPSKVSVRLAATKITRAIHLSAAPVISYIKKATKNGIMITLVIVSLFGVFIFQLSYQIIFQCPGHMDHGKISGHQLGVRIDKQITVHSRRVSIGSGYVSVLISYFSFYHNLYFTADPGVSLINGNLLLK